MKLKATPVQQADAVLLRPAWCPLSEDCIPSKRLFNDEDLDCCCGVSCGKVLSDGDSDTVYVRLCTKEPNEKSNTLGTDYLDTAELLAALADAHRTQLQFVIEGE